MCLFVAYIGLGVDVANACHDDADERKESGRVQHFRCRIDGDVTSYLGLEDGGLRTPVLYSIGAAGKVTLSSIRLQICMDAC